MKTLIVTGGAGFIGSNFINYILKTEPEIKIVNLDCLSYASNLNNIKNPEQYKDRYHFIEVDISNMPMLSYVFNKYRPDGVINFAAESHVDRSIANPEIFIKSNILGTYNLLKCSQDFEVQRYIQISTDEVYGTLGSEGFFTEESPICPSTPYSSSKASADHFVLNFYNVYGLNTSITRCSNNYGPNQHEEKLIPKMIKLALDGHKLPIHGDGSHIRDWLHVTDHCRAIWAVYNNGKGGEVYNVGGNNEKTTIDIVKHILDFIGKSHDLIEFVKDRPYNDKRYAIDSTKLKTEMDWKLVVTFSNGLNNTIEWYLTNPISI